MNETRGPDRVAQLKQRIIGRASSLKQQVNSSVDNMTGNLLNKIPEEMDENTGNSCPSAFIFIYKLLI